MKKSEESLDFFFTHWVISLGVKAVTLLALTFHYLRTFHARDALNCLKCLVVPSCSLPVLCAAGLTSFACLRYFAAHLRCLACF